MSRWVAKGRRGFRGYVRARLHRRIFAAMGGAILVSLLVSLGVAAWLGQAQKDIEPAQIERLVARQFAVIWHDQAERNQLADEVARSFSVGVILSDHEGRRLSTSGLPCDRPAHTILVRDRHSAALGRVGVCFDWKRHGWRASWLITPLVFAFFLWVSSGIIAHRLGRPLGRLVQVTREIGSGQLSSRARLGRHEVGELGVLAESINDMATRIEKQLEDQKELLAGVSHEMRTPLARLRVISELLEDGGASPKLTAEMQREIVELDDLIGQLLASARLDFHALGSSSLEAEQLARLALRRLSLSEDLLSVEQEVRNSAPMIYGDATLLERAVLNLLSNAQTHGGGVSRLNISVRGPALEFSVEDRGPGFSANDLPRIFESFYRGQGKGTSAGTLGLGLSLVRRIARAHGGDAAAVNLQAAASGEQAAARGEHSGARVSFWVPRPPAT